MRVMDFWPVSRFFAVTLWSFDQSVISGLPDRIHFVVTGMKDDEIL